MFKETQRSDKSVEECSEINISDSICSFNTAISLNSKKEKKQQNEKSFVALVNEYNNNSAILGSNNDKYTITKMVLPENILYDTSVKHNRTTKESINDFDKELQKCVHFINKTTEKQVKTTSLLSKNIKKMLKGKTKNEKMLQKEEKQAKDDFAKRKKEIVDVYIDFTSKIDESIKNSTIDAIVFSLFQELEKNGTEFIETLQKGEEKMPKSIEKDFEDIKNSLIKDIDEDISEIEIQTKEMIETNINLANQIEEEKEINATLTNELRKSQEKREEFKERIVKEAMKPMSNDPKECEKYFEIEEELENKKKELEKRNEINKIVLMPIDELIRQTEGNEEEIETLKELIYIAKEKESFNQDQSSKELLDFDDPSLILNESSLPIQVTGASLETLAFLIFHPGNCDPLFNKSLSLLIANLKFDLTEFFNIVSREYDISQTNEAEKNRRLERFIWEYDQWFGIKTEEVAKRFKNFQKAETKPKFLHFTNLDSLKYDCNEELLFCTDVMALTHSITAYELEIITSVPVNELKASEWTKPNKETTTPCLTKVTNHFNAVTEYVQTSILRNKSKSKAIERWIEIMKCAEKMNNFTLIFEISSAFTGKISAFEEWNSVSKALMKDFRRIDGIASPIKKFKNYNEKIAQLNVEEVVPYIGVYLTNLVFIHDGNPLKVIVPSSGKEVYNLTKQRAIAAQISFIKQHWGRKINIYTNSDLLNRVKSELSEPKLTDDEMNSLFSSSA